jgi:hypothetical protein
MGPMVMRAPGAPVANRFIACSSTTWLSSGMRMPVMVVSLTALVVLFFDLIAPAATRRLLAVLAAAIGLVPGG